MTDGELRALQSALARYDDSTKMRDYWGREVPVKYSELRTLIGEVVELRAENARSLDVWLRHETVQPDGEVYATVRSVLRENERMQSCLLAIHRIAAERLAATDNTDEAAVLWIIINATEGK